MMHYCKYHPKQHAAWFCQNCEVPFCSSCVPEDTQNYFPKCTLCRRSLKSLSVSHRIPPFWQQLPQLLTKPFNSGSILFILVFALVLSLLPPNKFGLILLLLTMLPIVEFMFDSMERMAGGDELPKKITKYLEVKNISIVAKLVIAYGLSILILVEIYALNASLGLIISGLVILGLPASLIILMMEKSIFSMLNPVKVFFIVRLFASAYFLLYAFMLTIASIVVLSSAIFSGGSTGILESTFVTALLLYLTLVAFLMAGYLVYQYHHELNFTINRKTLYQVDGISKSDDMLEVSIYIQEGRYEDAQKLLLQRLQVDPPDYKASEKLMLLYGIQGKDSFLQKIGEQYFKEMHLIGKQKQAADFLQKLDSKGFVVQSLPLEIVVGLVEQMKNKHQFHFALELLEKSLTANKKEHYWEYAYLAKAELLTEYANRSQEAVELLNHIINRSIDQGVMQQAEDYLQLINRRV